jgi:hypothetical protein
MSSFMKSTSSKASAAIGHNMARLRQTGSSPRHAASPAALSPSPFAFQDQTHRSTSPGPASLATLPATASMEHGQTSVASLSLRRAADASSMPALVVNPGAAHSHSSSASVVPRDAPSAQLDTSSQLGSTTATDGQLNSTPGCGGVGASAGTQLLPAPSGEPLSEASSSLTAGDQPQRQSGGSELLSRRSSISEQLARTSEGGLSATGSGSYTGEGQSERKGVFVRLQVCLVCWRP